MKKRPKFDSESFRRLQETRERLQGTDSFPYSEELRSIMETRVYSSPPDRMVREVLRDMAALDISSAVIVDGKGRPTGIITERDVMKRVVTASGVDPDKTPVDLVMTPAPLVLRPGNTIYRALSVLSGNGIKHLPLVADDGGLAGIITLRQLLKLRYPEPLAFIEGIRGADEVAVLRDFKGRLASLVRTRLEAGRRASDIVVMISLINRDIHARALDLVLRELGPAPAPFALYVTGSHGRLENLLTPDQDHGMVIADNPHDYQYDRYYVELSTRFSESLDTIGFASCPGYIMACNPLWRKSLAEWKSQVRYWMERQVPELGRFATILFDAEAIAGDLGLFREMKEHAFALLREHHEVLRLLYEEEGRHRVPVGFLGGFVTEGKGKHRGELDIKKSGLIFVLEAIRILALRYGIRETSTLKRIARLAEAGHVQRDDCEYFEAAYHVLLHLTLRAQVEKETSGKPVDTFINPASLSRRDRETLRHAFKAVSLLQDLVRSEFGELVL